MLCIEMILAVLLAACGFYITVYKNKGKKRRVAVLWGICVSVSAAFCVWNYISCSQTDIPGTALFWILYCCAVTDCEERKIPDYLSASVAVLSVLKTVYEIVKTGSGLSSLWNALLGAACVFALMLISSLLMKNGIGGGDIKLMTSLGLYFGFSGLFSLLLMSFLPAALFGIVLLILRKADIKTGLPFAPFVFWGLVSAYVLSLIVR